MIKAVVLNCDNSYKEYKVIDEIKDGDKTVLIISPRCGCGYNEIALQAPGIEEVIYT